MTGQVAAPQGAPVAPVAPAAPASDGNTGSGFLVGTEPAQPQRQVDWDGANAPTGSPDVTIAPAAPAPGTTVYTAEDIVRARQEEKTKLYDRLEEQAKVLKELQAKEDEREAARKKAEDDAAAELRRAEEEKMSAKELIEQVRRETEERINEVERQRQVERATFEKEREFARIEDYQRQRIDAESEFIMPELRDLISGSNEQEIEAAIEVAKSKTATILQQMGVVQQVSRQGMQGVSPTAPPVGPMEQQSTYETITPEDIAGMDMETYRKHRGSLLAASGRAYSGR